MTLLIITFTLSFGQYYTYHFQIKAFLYDQYDRSIFSHPGKITSYWITTRSFPYRGTYCPGQYEPRLRLRPIWVSLF